MKSNIHVYKSWVFVIQKVILNIDCSLLNPSFNLDDIQSYKSLSNLGCLS